MICLDKDNKYLFKAKKSFSLGKNLNQKSGVQVANSQWLLY